MIDKDYLYNKIMDKISISVKLILDETLTTYPYNKLRTYFEKLQEKFNIVINIIDDKQKCKVPPVLNNINDFDDILLYVWSLTDDIKVNKELLVNINNALQLAGYKQCSIINDNGVNKLIFTPNKLNDLNLSHNFFKNMLYFYHICPHYVTDKIKQIGFVPKSKNSIFSYDPRIHFYYGKYIQKIEYENLAYQLDINNKSKGNDHNYDIIKINIPDNIKFYKDLDSPGGIYTTENISPKYIEHIEPIKLTDNLTMLNNILNSKISNID